MEKLKKNHYWTTEELKALADKCGSRGEFYKKYRKAYYAAYTTGKLDIVCADLPPSRKKNKFVISYPNHVSILGPAFSCQSLKEFREKHTSAYEAGLRMGIDFADLFENIENVNYIKILIKNLYENAASQKLCFNRPTQGDKFYNKAEDKRIVVDIEENT